MTKARIYHELPDGRVLEVTPTVNRSSNDAIIGRPLSVDERARYEELRAEQRGDSTIFHVIHGRRPPDPTRPEPVARPPRPPASRPSTVEVPVEMLTKDQIARLIERRIKGEFASLRRMTREDLLGLFTSLN